jgi:hypothetical protein
MLSLDDLSRLRKHLTGPDATAPADLADLKQVLKLIYNLPEYQTWLNGDHFFGPEDARSRFYLPTRFGQDLAGSLKWLPERYGLINGDMLTAKIDVHEGRIHLTDGNWVNPTERVYPYTEESEQIVNFIAKRKLLSDVDLLVDPACGCGHHSLGLASVPRKINLDINPRALEFARLNAAIAGMHDILFAENDIRRNIPRPLYDLVSEHTLIVVNMPFSIQPTFDGSSRSLAQDGGDRGIEFTTAALAAIAAYMKECRSARVSAVVLFYSLGNPAKGTWDILDIAEELLPQGSYDFSLLEGQTMWRVNGRKSESNPMPIDRLATKALCEHTYSHSDRSKALDWYATRTAAYAELGFTDLGYGVLHIDSGSRLAVTPSAGRPAGRERRSSRTVPPK